MSKFDTIIREYPQSSPPSNEIIQLSFNKKEDASKAYHNIANLFETGNLSG